MGLEAKVDISKANMVFERYRIATKHTGAEVLNKFAKDVAYRSAEFTTFTPRAKIKSSLMRDPHLRYALTSMLLKRLGGKQLTANQVKYNTLNRLSRTKGLLAKGEFQKAVDSFVARRMASSKYLRASFAAAVERLGGTFKGSKFKGAGGFANKATFSRLIAEIVGILSEPDDAHARSAEKILIAAVHKAIADKLQDMLDHANKLLAQAAKASGG